MAILNKLSAVIYMLLVTITTTAQTDSTVFEIDSTLEQSNMANEKCREHQFKTTQLIIPTALIGIGAICSKSDWAKYQIHEIRDELQENIDQRISIDDYAQYAPAVAVYGLNACGVKGKHDFAERTIILGTAFVLMCTTVTTMKSLIKVERPDGSSNNSFPSGHTATAFMGAEFLRREFWDVSPFIGIAGYAVAVGTGFFRMYNNRHWLSDVIAGAGIGILSVQAAYWLYPTVTKTFFHKKYMKDIMLHPCFSKEEKSITCHISF